jgi:hypothetical protein
MTVADYKEMASEIRDLIPLLLHSQSIAELRLLADRYDRLAHSLELSTLSDVPFERWRSAS